MPPSASRAIVEPTTFTRPSVRAPRRFASRIAASVSAVSPDCEITMHSVLVVDDRVAVAELRRVLDLDRDARAAPRSSYSPISAECQLVPHAVMMMWSTLQQLLARQVQPAELRDALLERRGGRASCSRCVCGCSKISLSMKCSKPPCSICVEVPVDAAHRLRHRLRVEVDDAGSRRASAPPSRRRRGRRPGACARGSPTRRSRRSTRRRRGR